MLKVAEKNINILATRGLVFTNAVKHKLSKKWYCIAINLFQPIVRFLEKV